MDTATGCISPTGDGWMGCGAEVRSRILVVDDEGYMRRLLDEFLTRVGYRVTVASGGKEALMASEHQTFPVALIDLKMPGMNGVEVMDLLKVRHPDMAVVIMTGYPSLESAMEAMQKGAFDYIIKPFRLEELETVLKRAILERDLRQENQRLRDTLAVLEEQLRIYQGRYTASRRYTTSFGEEADDAHHRLLPLHRMEEMGRAGRSSQDVRSDLALQADRMYRAQSSHHRQIERILSMIRERIQTQGGNF